MVERAWAVTIAWGSGGRDLDIFTTVSSGGQTTSGIGWNNGSQTSVIQVNSGGINGTFYAKWGGDDTGWAGHEIVTVYFRGTLPSGHAQIATVTPHCNYYGEGTGPATVTVAGQSGYYEVAGPSTRYTNRAEATDPSVDVPLYADGGEPTPFPNLVTVSLNANGGSVSPSALYYITPTGSTKYGTLPTPTGSNGGVFQGWYTAASGGTLVDADSSLVSTSDHTLYAQWKYQVVLWRFANYPTDSRVLLDGTPDDQGGDNPARARVIKEYRPGSVASLEAQCRDALYRFAGWYLLGPDDPITGGTLLSTSSPYSIAVNSALEIRGDFKFIGIVIRAVASNDGVDITTYDAAISINGQSDPSRGWEYEAGVLIGSTVTLSANRQLPNVRFLRWQDSDGTVLARVNTFSFTATGQEDSQQEYYAIYGSCSNIKSSVSPADGGTIAYSRPDDSPPDDPGDHWYKNYSSVSLTATPASGFTFAFWTWTEYGQIQKSNSATYTIDRVSKDVELTAYFTPDGAGGYGVIATKYQDTGTTSGTGGTTSDDGVYLIGSTCTITATPNSGYDFDRWELNGSKVEGAEASYSFVVTGDQTYRAWFKPATRRLYGIVHPSGAGRILITNYSGDPESPTGALVRKDDTIKLSIYTQSGFLFDYLTVAGQIVQTSDYYGRYRTYSFVVTQDTIVEAFFDVVPAGQLIYDDATGRLICADDGGGLLYHDEVVYNH